MKHNNKVMSKSEISIVSILVGILVLVLRLLNSSSESNENPFGNSTTNQLTGNGSSTYPGFELIEKQKQPPTSKPIKLTGTSRNFAVQGVTTTIGQRQETQDSQVFDSLDVSIDLNETEQTETEQPNEAEKSKSRTLIRRPKSLPGFTNLHATFDKSQFFSTPNIHIICKRDARTGDQQT